MDNQNLNVLDEINKGACMGIDAISYIIDKVKDKKFKNYLKDSLASIKRYLKILMKFILSIIVMMNHTRLIRWKRL